MKPWMGFARLALLIAVPVSATAASNLYVPGEVLVKFKETSVRANFKMNQVYSALGVKRVRFFGESAPHLEQMILQKGISVEDTIQRLQEMENVEYAQPNYILSIPKPVVNSGDDVAVNIPCIPGMEIPGCNPKECILPGIPFPPGCEDGGSNPGNPGNPNPPAQRPGVEKPGDEIDPPIADPDLNKAWGIAKVGSPQAWEASRGDQAIVVAVIDTGVDYNHEDLRFNMWRNPNPTRNDEVGFDFVHNDGLPYDDQGHGTHVSGTIGAVGGNGVAISGVAQRVSIMALKFLTSSGSGTTADAVRAIDYAVENGAKILSNSWGGQGQIGNKALYDSIKRSTDAGALFVAAAGNEGKNNDGSDASYPAAFDHDNILAVAATDEKDGMAYFSNYGRNSTDLGAPGVNVYSSTPQNQYKSHSGTSMACPHVSGAAAVVWATHPEWTYKKVKEVLMSTVDPVSSLNGKTVTGGRLNLSKAMKLVN